MFVLGYTLFYWGYNHFSNNKYSISQLLGFGTIWNVSIPTAAKIQLPTDQTQGQQGAATTPNNLKGTPANPGLYGQGTPAGPPPTAPGKGVIPGAVSPRSIVGQGLTVGRTDQGVDFSGRGQLYAPGSGTIVSAKTSGTGWPGGTFIVLKLDDARGLPSPMIYYAENIAPAVRTGQRVQAGQLIGNATGGPYGIELGWADPRIIGQALARGVYTEGQATSLGQSFRKWIGF